MIARLGQILSRVAARIVPDPFVLALGLTLVVFLFGLAMFDPPSGTPADQGALETIVKGWYASLTNAGLLAFALQMCLVLVTGHALAMSPPVQSGIDKLSRLPKNAAAAAALVAVVACLAGVLHWGLGAIVGALLAREIGRHATARGMKVHYPLLGAAAYSGLAVWHGGFSGSAPLKVAEDNHAFAFDIIGRVPIDQTLLSPLNIIITGALLVMIPAIYFLMTPRREEDLIAPLPDQLPAPEPTTKTSADDEVTSAPPDSEPSPGGAISESAWINFVQEGQMMARVVGVAGLAVVLWLLADASNWLDADPENNSFALDLKFMILIFLFAGILMQRSIRAYSDAVTDGAKGAGPIILQFPFYFGILGMMTASGLTSTISDNLVAMSNATTFPLVAFFSAGIVNLFVPSGGGQWAVQADVLLQAGNVLGVKSSTTIMAFSYGDAWTNMLQPFWALPLLGIMGLKAKDIIGYTAVIFLAMGLLVGSLLLILTLAGVG